MEQFWSDLKGSWKSFKFASHDIDLNTPAKRFLRAVRPIVLTCSLVMVSTLIGAGNDEYKKRR